MYHRLHEIILQAQGKHRRQLKNLLASQSMCGSMLTVKVLCIGVCSMYRKQRDQEVAAVVSERTDGHLKEVIIIGLGKYWHFGLVVAYRG